MNTLADLDELLLRCRDSYGKLHITEAISCYRVGAFRACIVTTWIAIVLDVIGKLKELELAGDANAKVKIEVFNRLCEEADKSGNYENALKFEREILKVAKEDFELITQSEFEELLRVQQDRHKCAHPAMKTPDESYAPTAELARSHLRHAIEHLIAQPPVQGKAAQDRLFSEIRSPYFPTDTNEARKHFESGPLKRAKTSLVRNIVIALMKHILNDETEASYDRYFAAILAVSEMYRGIFEAVCMEKFSDIAMAVDASKTLKLSRFVQRAQIPWEKLQEPVRRRLIRHIECGPIDEIAKLITRGISIPELREKVKMRTSELLESHLAIVTKFVPDVVSNQQLIQLYKDAGSYRRAEMIGRDGLMVVADRFSTDDIGKILEHASSEINIREAAQSPDILTAFFSSTYHRDPEAKEYWRKFLSSVIQVAGSLDGMYAYPELRQKMIDAGIWDEADSKRALNPSNETENTKENDFPF